MNINIQIIQPNGTLICTAGGKHDEDEFRAACLDFLRSKNYIVHVDKLLTSYVDYSYRSVSGTLCAGSAENKCNLCTCVRATSMVCTDFAFVDFQAAVRPWLLCCFGAETLSAHQVRNKRFLEEALELVQSLSLSREDAHKLVDYVYGRPSGEPKQEVGGVMTTLAALCMTHNLNMHECGHIELLRVWKNVEQIRSKERSKPI
jgi:hypothetical protein